MRNDETRFFMVPQSSFILEDFITRNRFLRQLQPRTGKDREAAKFTTKAQRTKKAEDRRSRNGELVSYDPP